MKRYTVSLFLVSAMCALGTGCLGDPEIPECGDVPFETSQEECGTACDIYCDAMLVQCPDEFFDRVECIDQCQVEPIIGLRPGEFTDTTGNTVGCRLNALEAGGDTACEDASFESTEVCIDSACEDYCISMLNGPCTNAYAGMNECMSTCALIPSAPGSGDQDVNSIECRLRYALEAEQNNDPDQCHSASRTGGGTCGTECASYCGFVMRNCRNDFAIYDTVNECLEVCSFMDDENNSFDDWVGELDTVDCRTYHGSGPASQAPRIHCPHAQVFNPQHCGIGPGAEADPWPCTAFCNAVVDNCTTFDDVEQCEPFCAALPEVQAVMNNMSNGATLDIFPQGTQTCPRR